MFSPIKVLVVDDSALIRQMLTRALALDPRIEVVGVARNGAEAVEQAKALTPDVITLDIEMPELTGLEALPFLQKESDAKVLMLSSLDDPDTTYQALSLGAVDFISKPAGGMASSLTALSDVLIKKIKTAHRIELSAVDSMIQAMRGKSTPADNGERASSLDSLVCVASSTGGPPALEALFSGLGMDLPAAYLVVQHLPAGFTQSLAKRLDKRSNVDIREAATGDRIEQGVAYLAPYGSHMRVMRSRSANPRIQLETGEPIHGVIPSADPLLESAAESFPSVIGVVLTGMGNDGAAGLAAVKARGGKTIVQDESSSVVWGMPGTAVRMGVADRVMPLEGISMEIRSALKGGVASDG
jgi:two-component system chemotaxis response regulator CheB